MTPRPGAPNGTASSDPEAMETDESMDAADLAALEAVENSMRAGGSLGNGVGGSGTVQPRKMKITCTFAAWTWANPVLW